MSVDLNFQWKPRRATEHKMHGVRGMMVNTGRGWCAGAGRFLLWKLAGIPFLMLLSMVAMAQERRMEISSPAGNVFLAPADFDLQILVRGDLLNDGEIDSYWLRRDNANYVHYGDAPYIRLHHESGLPAGTYKYSVVGRAFFLDLFGNPQYQYEPSKSLTITVIQASGTIGASPANCVIPWGQSICPVTINWQSNVPNAQVWVSTLDNSGMALFAQQQSGSGHAGWINSAGQRFHLRAGSTTLATVDVRGFPTVNALPSVSLSAPSAGSTFSLGGIVPLLAIASDPDDGVAKVEFLVDGSIVATRNAAPFVAEATGLAVGTHSITAVATDTRGASSASAPVSVTISPQPAVGVTRHYVYDAHRRLCKVIEPETGATVMDYDAAGNLLWSAGGLALPDAQSCDRASALASGRVVHRTYDVRNRTSTLRFPDGNGDVDFAYTPDGLVQQATAYNDGGSSGAVTRYEYNKRRLLTLETLSQAGRSDLSLSYGYSGLGHLSSLGYPSGRTVSFSPNALGQATRAGDFATAASYHPNGTLKQFTYGNGVPHVATLNARQLPERLSDGTALILESAYDSNGNVSSIRDLVLGAGHDRAMQYDSQDRLVAASSAAFGGDGTHRFTYDALDNIQTWSLGGVKADQYWYDASNRLTNIQGSDGATTSGLSYDVQGNLASKNGQQFRFDYGNRLREVVGKASYRYDVHGRRVQTIDGVGATSISMYSNAGVPLYRWDDGTATRNETVYLGNRLVAEVVDVAGATEIKYQHLDALGSPVAVTNGAGQVLERTHYAPYGAPINRQVDGIGYAGHKMDAATGLSYMQQRYMDPQLGVFLSVDPVTAYEQPVGQFNRYRYANGNPYKFTDPDGKQAIPLPAPYIFPVPVPSLGGDIQRNEDSSSGDRQSGPSGRPTSRPTGRPTGRDAGRRGRDGQPIEGQGGGGGSKPGENNATGTIYVDSKGNAIPTPTGGKIEGSPDGRYIQAKGPDGQPTGVRIDGGHKPSTHPDPRAQQPHGHVPGVTNDDGTPWLPIKNK